MKRTRHTMKIVYRLFAAVCLSCTALVGCVADNGGAEAVPQTTVIRYSAEDLAGLAPGELLRLDLTLPNTAYVVAYEEPANLDRILVVNRDGQYILGDLAPVAAAALHNPLKQIVVSEDLSPSHPADAATTGAELGQDSEPPSLRIACNKDGTYCCICNAGVCQCGPTTSA